MANLTFWDRLVVFVYFCGRRYDLELVTAVLGLCNSGPQQEKTKSDV